jgi:glycosyltransferase involved in cell wall biosynthesis
MNSWKHLIAFPSVPWDFNWERQHELIFRLAEITPGKVIIHSPYGLINHSPRTIGQRFLDRNKKPNAIFKNPRHEKMAFVSPLFLPIHYLKATDALNAKLVARASGVPLSESLIYAPYANGFILKLFPKAACAILDLAQRRQYIPELSQKAKETERLAVATADLVFTDNIATKGDYMAVRKDIHYLPQGVNPERFHQVTAPDALVDWAAQFKQVAGYAGSDLAIDYNLLFQLIANNPTTGFLLVGRFDRPEAKELQRYPNVRQTGRIHYKELARYYAAMDVGLIPYQLTPRIEGVFPTKFFEYLASGLPVLTVPLPDLVSFASRSVVMLDGPDLPISSWPLKSNFKSTDADSPIQLALQHTWESRFQQFKTLLPPCR